MAVEEAELRYYENEYRLLNVKAGYIRNFHNRSKEDNCRTIMSLIGADTKSSHPRIATNSLDYSSLMRLHTTDIMLLLLEILEDLGF